MQREQILSATLSLLEKFGLATNSLIILAEKLTVPISELNRYWPDREALLYDCLRYHGQQIDAWRRQLLLDETLSSRQKLLNSYHMLQQQVQQQRYPGCLFIAACSFFPAIDHPIHQLAEQQKQASFLYTLSLLQEMDVDDADMVAQQMELIMEGCLSKLLVKRQSQDVAIAKRLVEDLLEIAQCRKNGALS